MIWKSLKGRLFLFTGPTIYRVIHAAYFFIRMLIALRSQSHSKKFFGPDLLAFAAKLKLGDQVLDIGAFLGGSTVLFGRAVGKSGKVWAFEPVHHRLLKCILFPFRLSRVKVIPIALAAENGNTEFLIPIYNGIPIYSQSGASESYAAHNGPNYTYLKRPTPLIRLDDFLAQQNIIPESLAAIKIDVEGSEMNVFTGGEDFFRRFQGLLLCEFWFNQVPPLGWIWLRERGYACRYLGKDGIFIPANTETEIKAICEGETYGNFFWEKPRIVP